MWQHCSKHIQTVLCWGEKTDFNYLLVKLLNVYILRKDASVKEKTVLGHCWMLTLVIDELHQTFTFAAYDVLP